MGALLISLHLWFWYGPRERALEPRIDDAPYLLLTDDEYRWRLWVAYPHQNLGALLRRLRAESSSTASTGSTVDSLSDLGIDRLPRFGLFRMPPARELTVAWAPAVTEQGERWRLEARIFPVVAGLARLAGRVAGNPWLAGGGVTAHELTGEVRWRGTLWTFRSEQDTLAGPSSESNETMRSASRSGLARPAISALACNQPLPWLGSGVFGLSREGGAWRVDSSSLGDSVVLGESAVSVEGAVGIEPVGLDSALALLAVERTRDGLRALAVLGASAAQRAADPRNLALPSSVALSTGPQRWPVLAEPLFGRLGLRLEEDEVAGVQLVASDHRAMAAGAIVAEQLAAESSGRLPASSRARSSERVEGWAVLDAGAIDELLGRLMAGLARSPLVAPSDLADFQRLHALVGLLRIGPPNSDQDLGSGDLVRARAGDGWLRIWAGQEPKEGAAP